MKKRIMMILMFCMVITISVGCGSETEEIPTLVEDVVDNVVDDVPEVDIIAPETEATNADALGEVVDYNLLNPELLTHGEIEENTDGNFMLQTYVSIDGGESSEIGEDIIAIVAEDDCIFQVIVIQDQASYWQDIAKEDITVGSMVYLEGDYLESGEFSTTKIMITNLIE